MRWLGLVHDSGRFTPSTCKSESRLPAMDLGFGCLLVINNVLFLRHQRYTSLLFVWTENLSHHDAIWLPNTMIMCVFMQTLSFSGIGALLCFVHSQPLAVGIYMSPTQRLEIIWGREFWYKAWAPVILLAGAVIRDGTTYRHRRDTYLHPFFRSPIFYLHYMSLHT
jgi:hypothetical protein